MGLTLETERLVLTEATEDDVDGLLAVALSNPDFTGDHAGSAGRTGRFDRDMLERDAAVAWMDPSRHPLVVRHKGDRGRVVGWAEVLDEHPRDLVPWIGLGWARAGGATALRLGVDEGNTSGFAFWHAFGFRAVDDRERVGPSGPVRVTVMERPLEPPKG